MKTYYEFFAGGGMARAGLGTDWQCLMANDICSKKATAYINNWGNNNFVLGDIKKLKQTQIPGHANLAWASFPCQDLSLAGAGAGLDGERSGTFWAFWKIIKRLIRHGRKPSMVMIENVYGALTSNDGKDFDAIVNAITTEGYVFGAMIIDAALFLPQSRPRLIILAVDDQLSLPNEIVRRDADPAWHPDAIVVAHKRLMTVMQNSWRWWNLPVPAAVGMTLQDIIEPKPTGVEWNPDAVTQRIISMMSKINRQKVMDARRSREPKVGTLYKRTRDGIQRAEVRFDGIAGCLRTPEGGSSRQTIIIVNGNKVRTRLLSPREAARLMGLSDNYILPEKYNEAYHLMGDGVAVPVVRYLADKLLNPIMHAQQIERLRRIA